VLTFIFVSNRAGQTAPWLKTNHLRLEANLSVRKRPGKHVNWEDALHAAIQRYVSRHKSARFTRQAILSEELDQIIADTGTPGRTPGQTLSRTLQLLRDRRLVDFVNNDGIYLYLGNDIVVEDQELGDNLIDAAIQANKLLLGTVATASEIGKARCRKGQSRLRALAIQNYHFQCALCDVSERSFLVASHIVRWADDDKARGCLSNVLCLCKIHDALFESGYISLADDLKVLRRVGVKSSTIATLLDQVTAFKVTPRIVPDSRYLQRHRERTGHSVVP
jgi:hypothetical protein